MFKGILTPVITVLDGQGKLDFEGNEIVINRLIDNGMDGLLFLGSIGEFFALSIDEKREFIRFVVKTVGKRVPVLIGTGGTAQEEVVELTQFSEKEGADGALVISPYYFELDSETIHNYFATIARSTSLPIMLYNFPDRTATDLSPSLVLRLAKEFSHIVGIKDTVDNISHTRKLIQVVKEHRPDFTVLSGVDEYLIPNLMAGGDGVLCGLTNIVPDLFASLMKAYHAKDFGKVVAAQAKISMLMNLYDITNPFIAGIKGAVALRGVAISTAVKKPAAALTQQEMNAISDVLAKADKM
jgi:4-hydroxy-tetrahydrodipicolinate synthase